MQRHAQAQSVSVLLEQRGTQVAVIVEDGGVGFEVEQNADGTSRPVGHRLGLLGMQERLELVGGTFTIESAPGEGTTLYARVPLEAQSKP